MLPGQWPPTVLWHKPILRMHYWSLQGHVTRCVVGYDVYYRQYLTWTFWSNFMAIHHGVHRYLVWLSQIISQDQHCVDYCGKSYTHKRSSYLNDCTVIAPIGVTFCHRISTSTYLPTYVHTYTRISRRRIPAEYLAIHVKHCIFLALKQWYVSPWLPRTL